MSFRSVRRQILALLASIVVSLTALPVVHGQQTIAYGAVVGLRGTPHLWIADARGVLHWGGDTRALSGKHVNWSNRTEVSLAELRTLPIGDPWLSAGLLKDGDPIYLVKWESNWERPRLLHIQSIADVELFGIDGSNYGRFVLDKATWEARYGITAASLQRSTLPAAVSGGAIAAPAPTATPAPVVGPNIDPALAQAYSVMRSTPVGNDVADLFVQLGASAVFGQTPLNSLNIRGFYGLDTTLRRITINDEYRGESAEKLAWLLIGPTVQLAFDIEGPPTSWRVCMERIVAQDGMRNLYWLQAFGPHGHPNEDSTSIWVTNFMLSRYLKYGHTEIWLSNIQRHTCAKYGESPFIEPVLLSAYYKAMRDGESNLGKAAVAVVVAAGTEVVFGSIEGYGLYSPSHNRIVISDSIWGRGDNIRELLSSDDKEAKLAVLASVLIHESYHVQEHLRREGQPAATAAACLQEEVEAFRLSASWWYEEFGRYGKRNANRVEQVQNNLMRAWFNRKLREWVLLSEDYQRQCLGGVVN